MRWVISNWFWDFPESISVQKTSVYGTPLGTALYGSVGAHGSTTDYWAAVGVTEQKAARSCLRLMSPCEESVPERAGILVHLTAMKNYKGAEPTKTQEGILITTTTMIIVTRLGVAHPSR